VVVDNCPVPFVFLSSKASGKLFSNSYQLVIRHIFAGAYCHIAEAFADPKVSSVLPTNLLLISGSSKTADRQQTLAYGAHGPKRLIVRLIE